MKHDYGSSGWEFDSKKDLDVVYVSGGMLSALARDEMHQPSNTEILACIKGKDRKYIYQQAAIKIQSFARAFLCRRV